MTAFYLQNYKRALTHLPIIHFHHPSILFFCPSASHAHTQTVLIHIYPFRACPETTRSILPPALHSFCVPLPLRVASHASACAYGIRDRACGSQISLSHYSAGGYLRYGVPRFGFQCWLHQPMHLFVLLSFHTIFEDFCRDFWSVSAAAAVALFHNEPRA